MEGIEMCEICHRSPCHPRCPNAPDPIPVFVCSGCGQDIEVGVDYWDVLGEQYCEYCIDEAREVADNDLFCFTCDEVIFEGEDYFEIMGKAICSHCIDNARRVAEYDDSY